MVVLVNCVDFFVLLYLLFLSTYPSEYKTRTTGKIKNKKIFPFSTDGFKVIRREFDNVLIPIDERVRYDENILMVYGAILSTILFTKKYSTRIKRVRNTVFQISDKNVICRNTITVIIINVIMSNALMVDDLFITILLIIVFQS